MTRTDVVRDYGGISAETRRADRRRKLLAAGRRAWGEQGLDSVTVRGVLAASGLTPRYFYEQFADRDALIHAVADELRDEIFSTLVASGVAVSGGLDDKLSAALTAFFRMIADDPQVHRILVSDPTGVAGLVQKRDDSLDGVTNLLIEHSAPLFVNPPTDEELRRPAQFMVGGVHQLVEGWLRDPRESPAELAAVCTRLCLAAFDAMRS